MCGCLCCKKRIHDKMISAPILDKELGIESTGNLPTRFSSSAQLFPPSISMDDFQPLKLVGKGGFGKVMLVKYLENNIIYAMKILKKEEIIKRKQVDHTKTERLLLEKLNHPFIAKLKYAFQDDQKLYLVTEFMQGGQLYFHLKRNSYFKEKAVKFYMSQVLLAIEYLHKNGYIYRDLKPQNILIDKDGNIKLTDFGLSKMLSEGKNTTDTLCGTPEYLAPEIIKGEPYTKCVDWFSFGILLYEMICGKLPFKLIDRKIDENVYDKKIEYPEKMSMEARDTIGKLLEIEPEKRLGYNSSEEVKNSEFFKNMDFDKVYNKEYRPPFHPRLNGDLDLKYFDANLIEKDADSEENLIVNSYGGTYLDKQQKEKEKENNNLQKTFDGFSYCKDDEEKNNSIAGEDSGMSSF